MAETLAEVMTLLAAGTNPDPGFKDGTVRCFVEEVTYASQADGDTIQIAKLPKGAIPMFGMLVADTSSGSATIAIGVSGTAGKYRAAAVFTATNTPTLFGVESGLCEALSAEETVIITVGTAALPSSGTLRVMFFYAFD